MEKEIKKEEKPLHSRTAVAVWRRLMGRQEKEAGERFAMDPEKFVKLLFFNPVIAAQANNEVVFEPHYFLGHTFPEGREFLGKDRFISMEQVVAEIRKGGRKVILNIGDSSTSGWDSDVITINRGRKERGEPLLLPFFRYRNYSDCLRELCGDKFMVLNAGIPAHSSLQGARRIALLMDEFARAGAKIDFVTIYYGNNDCAWNGNIEDGKLLPSSRGGLANDLFDEFTHMKLLIAQRHLKKALEEARGDRITTRNSPEGYRANLTAIIETCRAYGAAPILIEPLAPLYWEPGTRVRGEMLPDTRGKPGASLVYPMLGEAHRLWENAIRMPYSEFKLSVLKMVKEMDHILPRIKEQYLAILRGVAGEGKVPLVQLNLDRREDDGQYFIDYCHPSEKANVLIAEAIQKAIKQACGNRELETGNWKLSGRLKAFVADALSSALGAGEKDGEDSGKPSSNTYTLY